MLIQWLWLRGTPFGSASVPLVQQMVRMSFAEEGAEDGAADGPGPSIPAARMASSSAPTVMTGTSGATSRTMAAWSKPWTFVVVITTLGSVSPIVCRSSCWRYWTGSGDTMAPIRAAAR